MTIALTYGGTALGAGLGVALGVALGVSVAASCAASLMQRFGVSPISVAAQGTRVPSTGRALGFQAAATTHALPQVDRKADDRVPPRGRRH